MPQAYADCKQERDEMHLLSIVHENFHWNLDTEPQQEQGISYRRIRR